MLTMLVYLTLGLLAVLACRRPARRLFGAGPAFTLWLLPPLLATLPWLPALPADWSLAPATMTLPAIQALTARAEPVAPGRFWPLLLWLGGALVFLLRLMICYVLLQKQSRRLPAAMRQRLRAELPELDSRRVRLHSSGPAVLWAPRSWILLPMDFFEHFDADQRRLIVQHERMHLRRGDAWWSLLAELAVALLWFHPLAWLSLPRLRLDQELACDERVLHRFPQEKASYARTLLHSAGVDPAPVLIPWLAQPQLKERLNMIQHHRPGTLRRRGGFLALAALMATAAVMAQAATRPDRPTPAATQELSFNEQHPPRYPESAIKNREQGTVVLRVLVGTDGKPRGVEVDPTTNAPSDLIKAASDAAMSWRFNPQRKHGKAIESYARVPISFNLDPSPPATPSAATTPTSHAAPAKSSSNT